MPWQKQFDIDETLRKAGEAFWENGYEATSMTDLLAAMGIQKGSFYNAFGSKHAVYLDALEQYSQATLGQTRELIADMSALEALRTHFEAIREDCVGPTGHRGCMVVNCALEVAHQDERAREIVKKALGRHEGLLGELIRAGQAGGEIDPAIDADATAKVMMSIIMGMRVYSRSGSDPEATRTLADQAMRLVSPVASSA